MYLYVIKCLVFITETQCVYCAVRTGSSTVVWLSSVFEGLNYECRCVQRLGVAICVSVFRHVVF